MKKELKLTTQAIRKVLENNGASARTTNKTVDGIVKGNVALTRQVSLSGVDVKVWCRENNKITEIRVWDFTKGWKEIENVVNILVEAGYNVEHEKSTPCCYVTLK